MTLSIPPGMYGLLGPNGAGKSTPMRSVVTLQTPSEGTIRFGDIDQASPSKAASAAITCDRSGYG